MFTLSGKQFLYNIAIVSLFCLALFSASINTLGINIFPCFMSANNVWDVSFYNASRLSFYYTIFSCSFRKQQWWIRVYYPKVSVQHVESVAYNISAWVHT